MSENNSTPERQVRVVMESECIPLGKPASVWVYDGDVLIHEIHGTVERRMGADGGMYPAVVLAKAS